MTTQNRQASPPAGPGKAEAVSLSKIMLLSPIGTAVRGKSEGVRIHAPLPRSGERRGEGVACDFASGLITAAVFLSADGCRHPESPPHSNLSLSGERSLNDGDPAQISDSTRRPIASSLPLCRHTQDCPGKSCSSPPDRGRRRGEGVACDLASEAIAMPASFRGNDGCRHPEPPSPNLSSPIGGEEPEEW